VVIFPLEKSELVERLEQTGEPGNDARKVGKTARSPARDRLEFVGQRSSVRMNGVETNLTKNEFKLLVLLASHIDQLVEFGDLSAVIGHHDSVKSGNLRTYISQLRTKVPPLREKLVAVEGYGFRLTGVAVVAPELGPELGA
jgi:DNA-binding response OmpR family regulator